MKAKGLQSTIVTLELDLLESVWLKGKMQNPLHGQKYEDESQTDKTMREIFWNALDEAGVVI